jgi:hypothetical protein
MKERVFASAALVLGFCGVALALGMSAPAQRALAARTDLQAQARTAADLRNVGTAMFSWLTDQVGAAAAGQSQMPEAVTVQLSDYPAISHEGLTSLLVPQYIQKVPELDGWNHPYDLYLNTANPLAPKVMALRSPGRDGVFSGSSYDVGRFEPDSFDEDIVWADGFSVRWPGIRSDREAQEQTREDIHNIGTAMFSWLTDQVGFAAEEPSQVPASSPVYMSLYAPIPRANLQQILVPQYIQDVPELDGWGGSYQYYLDTANPLAQQVMAIRSNGRDRSQETDIYSVTAFDPDDFEQDIVWADGFFVRWPATGQGLPYYAVPACRVLDTRPASALQSGVSRLFEIGGACGIPTTATSVAVTVTVVGPTGSGHVTLFPAGSPVPAVSTINFAAGQTRSNNAVLSLSGDAIGSIGAQASLANGGQVHLVLDVNGYWE